MIIRLQSQVLSNAFSQSSRPRVSEPHGIYDALPFLFSSTSAEKPAHFLFDKAE